MRAKRKSTRNEAKGEVNMATKKRAGTRKKKGTHFASLGKKVPAGYMAFVQGNEVRIVKQKRAKRTAKKR